MFKAISHLSALIEQMLYSALSPSHLEKLQDLKVTRVSPAVLNPGGRMFFLKDTANILELTISHRMSPELCTKLRAGTGLLFARILNSTNKPNPSDPPLGLFVLPTGFLVPIYCFVVSCLLTHFCVELDNSLCLSLINYVSSGCVCPQIFNFHVNKFTFFILLL